MRHHLRVRDQAARCHRTDDATRRRVAAGAARRDVEVQDALVGGARGERFGGAIGWPTRVTELPRRIADLRQTVGLELLRRQRVVLDLRRPDGTQSECGLGNGTPRKLLRTDGVLRKREPCDGVPPNRALGNGGKTKVSLLYGVLLELGRPD